VAFLFPANAGEDGFAGGGNGSIAVECPNLFRGPYVTHSRDSLGRGPVKVPPPFSLSLVKKAD
jgi:hypothetical protein